MEKIYRFRSCEYSLNALLNFSIEGTKFKIMGDDQNEVHLFVDAEKISSITKIDKTIIDKTSDIVRNHIMNSYYLSCFTIVDQTNDPNMWKNYANTTGFCVVYDYNMIKNAVKWSSFSGKGFYLFRSVDYGDKSTDITPFVEDYLRLVADDIDNEEAHRKAAELVGNNLSEDVRKKVINCMFHKIGSFPEKTEIRIVTQRKNHKKDFCESILEVDVKPIEIICSPLMTKDNKITISKFCAKHHIKYTIKNIDIE